VRVEEVGLGRPACTSPDPRRFSILFGTRHIDVTSATGAVAASFESIVNWWLTAVGCSSHCSTARGPVPPGPLWPDGRLLDSWQPGQCLVGGPLVSMSHHVPAAPVQSSSSRTSARSTCTRPGYSALSAGHQHLRAADRDRRAPSFQDGATRHVRPDPALRGRILALLPSSAGSPPPPAW
jgi:hypothetical protein